MWSCEWAALKESQADIKDFLETLNLSQPLSVKDAFKGGRTNAFKLHYEVKPGEKIHHIDVTSLYPTVNKHESYPVGHPEIILSNFRSVKEYFGIVKCIVKAPDADRFPVLPATFIGKLVFSFCKKCATDKNQDFCNHDGAERHLEGTWCTPELRDAIDHGYEVVKVHEVWHWDRQRDRFFCIQEVHVKEGIILEKEKVEINPGLKAVSKRNAKFILG